MIPGRSFPLNLNRNPVGRNRSARGSSARGTSTVSVRSPEDPMLENIQPELGHSQPGTQHSGFRRFYQRFRRVIIFAFGLVVALMSMIVYDLAKPQQKHLTENNVESVIKRTLDEAPPEPSFAAVAYEVIRPSVVFIHTAHGSIGTGFVIVDTGIILTSLHVVRDASSVLVIFADGSESEAIVIVRQPENDLAALQAMVIPDDLIPATMAGSTTLQVGDDIVAVGHPFGISNSVSSGVVSGLQRQYDFPETGITLTDLIQFDAAVNPGNSGGPLINRDGEVVGIVTALVNPTNQEFFVGIGFAVTIETAAGAAGDPEW